MARVTIPWETGTGNIYVDYTSSEAGVRVVSVSSDVNNLYQARVQDVTFTSSVSPNPTAVLRVRQEPKIGDFNADFNSDFSAN